MIDIHETYMQRCLDLAILGKGKVMPNPMVGAVLVHNGRIIGEGYHREYGQPHAEVNCINNVTEEDKALIPDAVMYVSLEPCAHFGKTPPCADLIIRKGIKEVFVGCRDPFTAVDGKGIEKMESAGIRVTTGVLEQKCRLLNKRFLTFHTKHRPYIILKWAQTANGKMAGGDDKRLLISNEYTNRLVHQWRAEEAAILVGTHTAQKDNPSLDNRLYTGRSPVRMVLDLSLRLPASLTLFDGKQQTIVFNHIKHEEHTGLSYYRLNREEDLIQQIITACYQLNLQSLIVEGGAQLLHSFIQHDNWDEARIITNPSLTVSEGLDAPVLPITGSQHTEQVMHDQIRFIYRHPFEETAITQSQHR